MSKAYIVCGSPGAGKTTYAKSLARKYQAILLDIDTVTEKMVKAGMKAADHDSDDRDSSFFKEHFRDPIYSTLFTIAHENLPWTDVVIVGPFTRELRNRFWIEKLQTTLEAETEIHYIYCQPEVRRGRLIQRGNPRDNAKLADWENHIEYYGDESPPAFPHILVDTSKM